jgi:hypothetical protein
MNAATQVTANPSSRLLLVAVVLAACVSGALAPAQEAPSLRAGAAAVDVSPREFPSNMPGGFTANLAEGSHDPLHARALVLSDGTITLAMVVVDNLGVAREVGDEAKALAAERTGIPPERVLLAATHTHSAPASTAEGYRKLLVTGIAESIAIANQALRPAAVGHGAHPLPEEVFNRRWYLKPGQMPPNPFGEMDEVRMNPGTSPDVLDRPAGPTDPDLTILSVRDAKSRKPLALFANYALHYVGGTPSGMVSADYFGEFARLMPSRLRAGEEFVAMMSNGASGDINNIPFLITRPPREPFEQIRIVASKAADAGWFAHAAIESHEAGVRLGMLQREVTLRVRRPTEEQVAWAKGVLAITDEAERAKLPRLAEAYARRTLNLAEADETVNVLVQALRIGDLAVCALPFEALVEIGLDLKQRSPFPQTMVIGIANGYHGYLPTPKQHKLGGYETWMGTCRVEKDSSVILTNHLLEMLGVLADDRK